MDSRWVEGLGVTIKGVSQRDGTRARAHARPNQPSISFPSNVPQVLRAPALPLLRREAIETTTAQTSATCGTRTPSSSASGRLTYSMGPMHVSSLSYFYFHHRSILTDTSRHGFLCRNWKFANQNVSSKFCASPVPADDISNSHTATGRSMSAAYSFSSSRG